MKGSRNLPLTKLEYSIEQHYGRHLHLTDPGIQIFEKFAQPTSIFMRKPVAETMLQGKSMKRIEDNTSLD